MILSRNDFEFLDRPFGCVSNFFLCEKFRQVVEAQYYVVLLNTTIFRLILQGNYQFFGDIFGSVNLNPLETLCHCFQEQAVLRCIVFHDALFQQIEDIAV